jgi:hypothetical protein
MEEELVRAGGCSQSWLAPIFQSAAIKVRQPTTIAAPKGAGIGNSVETWNLSRCAGPRADHESCASNLVEFAHNVLGKIDKSRSKNGRRRESVIHLQQQKANANASVNNLLINSG